MCTSFGDASASLCDSLSPIAGCLSTVLVDSAILMPFVACQLIPPDKCPGVRELGIFLIEIILPKPSFSLFVIMLYLLWVLYSLVLDMLLDQRLQSMPCRICFILLIVKLLYWWMLLVSFSRNDQ